MIPAPAAGGPRDTDADGVLATARLNGRPLLIFLDIDGTLAPIAPHPSLARVPAGTRRALASLAARAGVFVILVSGRAAQDARRLCGVEAVWTIGNHGAEVIGPDGHTVVDKAVSRYANAVASAARDLDPLLKELPGVALENKTWTLSVHYRGADERVLPRLHGVVEEVAAKRGLHVTTGKKVLEVRPPVRVDKGSAVATIARDLGAPGADASLLYAGDDATDEDAFRLLRAEFPNAVTIHVGNHENTAAEFRFSTLLEVRALLERLAQETGTSE